MTRINILFCLVIIEFYKYTKLRVLPPQGSSHQKAQLKHSRSYVPIVSHLGLSLHDKWPRLTHRQTIKCSPFEVRIHNSVVSMNQLCAIRHQCITIFCIEIMFHSSCLRWQHVQIVARKITFGLGVPGWGTWRIRPVVYYISNLGMGPT